ncbi:hypothetical protein RhiirC2_781186 [Rhizophagus irregularis]|uniref:Uncharacterized protein n=1 Tax=Rhizophagus irregularis TaxID=588596 RepID=A0A2N1N5Z4_9GLOM|nr:hypothetical protein RhiirC2_781186 [Rhizophagus irregularis]
MSTSIPIPVYTTRGRLIVNSEIQKANNQIKYIINILMQRCKAKHEELGITKDLSVFTQNQINKFDETFTNLERQLIIIRAANDNFIEENYNLQRDYDTMVELR